MLEPLLDQDNSSSELSETHARPNLLGSVETVSRWMVGWAMPPQGILGALLFYSLIELGAGDEREDRPGLYYLAIGAGLLICGFIVGIIVRSRVGVVAPFVTAQMKKCAISLMGRSDEPPRRLSRKRRYLYHLGGITNVFLSTNISLVFGGLIVIAFDVLAKTLRQADLDGPADVVSSPFFKVGFIIDSITINIFGYYNVHQTLAIEVRDAVNTVWRYSVETKSVKDTRQRLLGGIQQLRRETMMRINQQLKNSADVNESSLCQLLKDTLTAVKQKDFRESAWQEFLQKTRLVPGTAPSASIKLTHYSIAGLMWGIGMVSLWNFVFLQRQALQFLLMEGVRLDADTADKMARRYVDGGGKYLLGINMGAFLVGNVGREMLNWINRRSQQLEVRQALPYQGGYRYWLRVWLIALVANFPNGNAALVALDDAQIPLKSAAGVFLLMISIIGLIEVNLLGMHRDDREQALRKIEATASVNLRQALTLPGLIDECASQINQLTSADIETIKTSASADLLEIPEPESILMKLRSLSRSCLRWFPRVDAQDDESVSLRQFHTSSVRIKSNIMLK